MPTYHNSYIQRFIGYYEAAKQQGKTYGLDQFNYIQLAMTAESLAHQEVIIDKLEKLGAALATDQQQDAASDQTVAKFNHDMMQRQQQLLQDILNALK